ncbi:MAG: hypothetical protein RJA63_1568 [Pseudomonadota bacterium]|jgi:hypothetical protein
MSLKDFFSAIAASDKTPCDEYHCKKQIDCAAYKLACDSWLVYVETGRELDPHIKLSAGAQLSTRVRNAILLAEPMPDRLTFKRVEAA